MTIKQRIQTERGEYTRARRKKFQFLKHTGQLSNYYKSKMQIVNKPKAEIKKEIKLNRFEKIMVFIKVLFKTLKLRTGQ